MRGRALGLGRARLLGRRAAEGGRRPPRGPGPAPRAMRAVGVGPAARACGAGCLPPGPAPSAGAGGARGPGLSAPVLRLGPACGRGGGAVRRAAGRSEGCLPRPGGPVVSHPGLDGLPRNGSVTLTSSVMSVGRLLAALAEAGRGRRRALTCPVSRSARRPCEAALTPRAQLRQRRLLATSAGPVHQPATALARSRPRPPARRRRRNGAATACRTAHPSPGTRPASQPTRAARPGTLSPPPDIVAPPAASSSQRTAPPYGTRSPHRHGRASARARAPPTPSGSASRGDGSSSSVAGRSPSAGSPH